MPRRSVPVALAVAVGVAGCFAPDLGDDPFRCGAASDECPPGYRCGADDVCHRRGTLAGDGSVADGAPLPDAMTDAPPAVSDAPSVPDARADAPLADAPVTDAPPLPPDGFACRPSTFRRCLDATTAEFCDPTGTDTIKTTCEYACDAVALQCNHCAPGLARCVGDDLITCSPAGVVTSTTTCTVGCVSGACTVITPTGLPDVCRTPGTDDTTMTGAPNLDTTTCSGGTVVSQPAGPALCVYKFRNLTVASGATVRWSGSLVPVVVATNELRISGKLLVNGQGAAPGAAALEAHAGDGTTGSSGDGSGGGGHATAGGNGATLAGSGRVAPAGGPALDATASNVLAPGGSGGAGGGGGGGALGLVACFRMTLDPGALVNAGGGGGLSGTTGALGGAGGGAGGTLRLEAAEIVFSGAGGVLAANGGGAGGGGGVAASSPPAPGDDGRADDTAAKGAAGALGAGAGGAGGTSDGSVGVLPEGGAANSLPTSASGGGGGAAGVIVIRTRPERAVAFPAGSLVSPAPRVGAVGRQPR